MLPPKRPTILRPLLALILLAASTPWMIAHAAQKTEPGPSPISLADAPNWSAGGIAWARPILGKPLRGLLIAPSHTLRDAVELARHIEIELDVAPVDPRDTLLDAGGLDALRAQLKRKLDVIILAGVDPQTLPVDIQNALIERIGEGVGLVRVSYGPNPFPNLQQFLDTLEAVNIDTPITRGTGEVDSLGVRQEQLALRLYEGENARAVEMDYPGPAPIMHCLLPALRDPAVNERNFLDTHFSAVIRAVRWAARRDPPLTIQRIESLGPQGPDAETTPPNIRPEFVQTMRDAAIRPISHPYGIYLSGPAPDDYTVRVQVRYPHKQIQRSFIREEKLAKGARSYTVYVPHANGDCVLDVWLLDEDAVVDWYSVAVHADGWPEIANVTYSKFAVKTNDTLTVSLDVRQHFHRPRPCTVYARATDPLGKVVAEKYVLVNSEGGRVHATLNLTNLDSEQLRIDVYVADTPHGPFGYWYRENSAHHVGYVRVARPAKASFRFIADGIASAEPNVRGLNQTLAAMGVDTIHLLPNHPDALGLTFDNLSVMPNLFADASGLPKTAQRDVATYSDLGARAYCLIDAATPSGQAPTPASTEHNSQKATARWIQSRRTMDTALLDRYQAARAQIHAIDDRAQLGLYDPGPNAAAGGPDWQQLASKVDFIRTTTDRATIENVRSFLTPGQQGFMPLSAGIEPPTAIQGHRLPWYAALHDLDGIWIGAAYAVAGADPALAALYPDGRAAPWFVEASRSVKEIRSGYATLLASARRANSAIAILSSRTSTLLNAADGDNRIDSLRAESEAIALLEGLGYQFDIISTQQSLSDALAEYSVLILPAARALGDEEIKAIVAFTAQGGAVIADFIPGCFDAHGTRRDSNPLATVFGVRQNGTTRLDDGPLVLRLPTPSAKRDAPPLPTIHADASIIPTVASVGAHVGKTPLWLVRDTGPSLTVLLNHALIDTVDSPIFQSLFDDWLTRSGAQKILPELSRKGRRYQGERVLYHYGEARIVALLCDPAAPEPVQKLRPSFPKNRYSYNMRSGEALRRSKTATVKLKRGEVGLFSSLPYEVSRIVLNAPRLTRAGGRIPIEVSVRTRVKLPGKHLIFLSLAAANGNRPPIETKVLECPDGHGQTHLPVAFNAPPGMYTLTARDVLTGIQGSTEVELSSSAQ